MSSTNNQLLVVGELNGWAGWTDIDLRNYGKVVFLGNLLSYDGTVCSISEYYKCVSGLFRAKELNPDKVFLILGLEDLDYFTKPFDQLTGIGVPHENMKRQIYRHIREGRWGKMVDIVHQHSNFLFSYGGILNDWFETHLPSFVKRGLGTSDMSFGKILNEFWRGSLFKITTSEGYHQGGSWPLWSPGPLYTQDTELMYDPMNNVCQAVSGERQENGVNRMHYSEQNAGIWFCNALDYNRPINAQRENLLVLEPK